MPRYPLACCRAFLVLVVAMLGVVSLPAQDAEKKAAVPAKAALDKAQDLIKDLYKKELENADHDFGGHRKEAIEAIDVAIKQLEKALKFDKN